MSKKRNEQLNTYVLCPLAILLLILLVGVLMWSDGDWADPWAALRLSLLALGGLYVCYAVIYRMRDGLRVIAKLNTSTSRNQGVS